MKIVKRIIKFTGILIGILLLSIGITIAVDAYRTGYLDVTKNKAETNSYLLTRVNVIPMNQDTVLTNKMVYIKDGKIQDIQDSIPLENIEVIDGKNKYLLPGLIDMHVHVWDKYELGLYLANGVTAIRNVWGMPMHLRMKKEINSGTILAPAFYTTGPKLTGPEFIGDDNLQLFSPEEAKQKIRSYKARGYDFVKSYYGLTEDIFDAVVEQAIESDMDIVAHPSQKVPYAYHFKPQIKSIEHTEDIVQQALKFNLDTAKLQEIIALFEESPHTGFCPTLMAFYNIYNMLEDDDILATDPVRYINPSIQLVDSKAQFNRWFTTKQQDPAVVDRILQQHQFHLLIIKKLNEAGVPIACGTDAGIGVTLPGFSLHDELALYQEAGLSNFDILKTATINASKVHQLMNHLGSIEPGKTANLILTDSNPLEDLSTLRKPEMVFVNGRKLNRETLDLFEVKAKDRPNMMVSIFRYLENMVVEK
jgi:hypothetical protein